MDARDGGCSGTESWSWLWGGGSRRDGQDGILSELRKDTPFERSLSSTEPGGGVTGKRPNLEARVLAMKN